MSKARDSKTSSQIDRIILASASVWRRNLLESTGITFSVETSSADESVVTGPDAGRVALGRAELKARSVCTRGSLVIGADQTLSCEGTQLRKAQTPEEARAQLARLAGKTHWLHSAVVLVLGVGAPEVASHQVRVVGSFCVDIAMSMRQLRDAELDALVAAGDWKGSVGSYKIEGQGVHLFTRVGGDSSAIIGLPLPELLSALRALGINPLLNAQGPWRIPDSFF
jgi:septum formation protein